MDNYEQALAGGDFRQRLHSKRQEVNAMLMLDEILEQPRVLAACSALNKGKIQNLTAELRRKEIKNVVIAARGTSDHAAIYAKYCIEILTGKPVSLAAPSVVTLYGGRMDYKDTLVIGVTQSGMAEDVRQVLACANAQGALSVGITNNESSPVANESAYHLYCDAGPEMSVAATKTFTTQMLLLGLLAANWGGDAKLVAALERMPGELQAVLDKSEAIIHSAGRYKFADQCFILARGLLYSVALEAALKIQETTYTSAKAYPISDFYHGPLAMVEKNTPVIVYCGNDAAKNDALDMVKRLRALEADILAVTSNEEISVYANETLLIPDALPMAAPFHHVAAAQLFAYGLAIEKGLNPDAPRSLKKVTITK